MNFDAHTTIHAPIAFVFDQVTDFEKFERAIKRRGGDVARLSKDDAPPSETRWRVEFRLSGQIRTVFARLAQVDAPGRLSLDIRSRSADGEMLVTLEALSETSTRVVVTTKARAKSITAKMLFQSVRFARVKSERKFSAMVAGFGDDVEALYRA